jgi:uncharacterized protein
VTVVVSDTSPIHCLHDLRLLEILPQLFGTVLVPPAVARELKAPAPGIAPVDPVLIPSLRVRAPEDATVVQQLMKRLHAGEAEALALAVEVKPDVVLIDEKTGRAVAKELGLVPLGVLGTLVNAKRAGLISQVAPMMMRLKRELDFRVSAQVEQRILELAGE